METASYQCKSLAIKSSEVLSFLKLARFPLFAKTNSFRWFYKMLCSALLLVIWLYSTLPTFPRSPLFSFIYSELQELPKAHAITLVLLLPGFRGSWPMRHLQVIRGWSRQKPQYFSAPPPLLHASVPSLLVAPTSTAASLTRQSLH